VFRHSGQAGVAAVDLVPWPHQEADQFPEAHRCEHPRAAEFRKRQTEVVTCRGRITPALGQVARATAITGLGIAPIIVRLIGTDRAMAIARDSEGHITAHTIVITTITAHF